jgi:hypothetical protein
MRSTGAPGIPIIHTWYARSNSALPVGCSWPLNAENFIGGSTPWSVSTVESSTTTTEVPSGRPVARKVPSTGDHAFANVTCRPSTVPRNASSTFMSGAFRSVPKVSYFGVTP